MASDPWKETRYYEMTPHQRRNMRRLRAAIERRRATYLWGKKHMVTPRLLMSVMYGDGRQLVCIAPIDNRPNWYVVRVDSRVVLSNHDTSGRPQLHDGLDAIYNDLEDEWPCECVARDDDREHCKCPWPVADLDTGCEWSSIDWPKGFRNWPVAVEGCGEGEG